MHRSLPRRSSPTRLIAACAALPLLAACGASDTPSRSSGSQAAGTASATASPGSGEREVSAVKPRVLIAGEGGGLTLVDARTGKSVHQQKLPGFLRLNPAGDGRRVMVTAGNTFRVYDTGIESQAHGDHHHNYEYQPGLTKVAYRAKHPGHVVTHGGNTVLFGDGDGSIQVIPTEQIGSSVAPVQRSRTNDPHHGVAVTLEDGTLLSTQGTEDARSVVQARKGDKVIAKTSDCPGVHGEAVARGGAVAFGCENGPVVFRDGTFHKIKAKDPFARTGNLAATHDSPVVLGDYKVKKDAELERPTRVALINTQTEKMNLVDLGSPYWFRSLARGPHGEAMVLTYDGKLALIDPQKGTITKRIPVVAPWKEKKDWQQPGPIVQVAGEQAYVTDAARKQLIVVDLKNGKVTKRHQLSTTPLEMAVTTGAPAEEKEGKDGEHQGHDH